jgi:diamine N-acetyltransferase
MTDSQLPDPQRGDPVSLRPVTRETAREIMRLKVKPEQEKFVATNAVSIAQAYFDREHAWFRAIYAGETPVGFLMLYDAPEEPEYFLWRFMIDARYQKLGFAWKAMDLLVEYVRSRPNASFLGTSCVPEEGGPGPFYEKYGFRYTGEEDDGELVMRLAL